MHARNRTWALGSDPAERCRQRILPIEGGDGSTLSLDFTTGQLDPRLTFTRASNATFINSNGLVEWANANMYWNTAFEGLSGTNPSLTSSGWGYVFSSGNAVFNGDTTVTMTTTAAQRSVLFRSSGFSGGGLRVVSSVDVTIHSGSLQASQVIVTGTPANAQHYVNGLIWNNTHPNWNGGILPVGTQFNIAYATDTQTSGTTSMWFGVGCSSAIAGSATFVNPRWTMWKGSATVPYYPNTSATNNVPSNNYKSADYQAPRFDYDPTTLAPKGLLIEATATNPITYSDCSTTGWAGLNATGTNNNATAPDNNTAATLWTGGSGGNNRAYSATFSITNGTSYTLSVYVKKPSTNAARYAKIDMRSSVEGDVGWPANGVLDLDTGIASGTGFTATPMPNGWYRIASTGTVNTTTNARAFLRITDATGSIGITSTNALLWWGAQVEAGSGPSSLIPTGASTVQRLADICYLANTDYGFTTNGGTYLAEWNRGSIITAGSSSTNAFSTDYASGRWLGIYTTGASSTGVAGSWSGYLNSSSAVAGINKMAVSYSSWVASASGNTSLNGGAIVSGTLTLGTTPTYLFIGGASSTPPYNGGGYRDQLNNCVRRIKYWPTVLSNAQLQALTT